MRNALFFDIDGTLLSDVTGKIPDSALDALKKTIETWKSDLYQYRQMLLQRSDGIKTCTVFRISVWMRHLHHAWR